MAKTLYEKTETEIESGLHLSHDFDKIQSEFLRLTREWLAGKLIAGSEKANSHNEVILKLLAELKDGENKQVETMIMRKEEYDDVMAKNRDMCKCGHIRMFHSVSDDGRESTWCCKFECECKKFTLDKPKTTEKE